MTSLDVFLEGRAFPRYLLGQRVYFADGRNGIVLDSAWNPNAAQWQYAVEGIGAWFLEGDLTPTAPPPPPEERVIPELLPSGDGITRSEVNRLLADALSFVTGAPGITEARLDAVVRDAVTAANLTAQADNQTLRNDLGEDIASLGEQFANLESALTTTQSEILERLNALDVAADAVAPDVAADADAPEVAVGGILGLFSGVGSFLRDPFKWLSDRVGDQILNEVRSGFNR